MEEDYYGNTIDLEYSETFAQMTYTLTVEGNRSRF